LLKSKISSPKSLIWPMRFKLAWTRQDIFLSTLSVSFWNYTNLWTGYQVLGSSGPWSQDLY
jgi:hypothetical protein